MAYTDLTSAFAYKTLLTYQLAADLAVNDKLFNDQLTGAISIPNDLKLGNAKALRGEVAATGTWRTLASLDAGNIVQLGDAATEVRVPADPTNVLGVATKQYVDGVQMFETQPKISASGGNGGAYVTILSIAATKRGHIRAVTFKNNNAGTTTPSVRITVDGGTPQVYTTLAAMATNTFRALTQGLVISGTDKALEGDAAVLIDIAFNSSILVEATTSAGTGDTVGLVYDKI